MTDIFPTSWAEVLAVVIVALPALTWIVAACLIERNRR